MNSDLEMFQKLWVKELEVKNRRSISDLPPEIMTLIFTALDVQSKKKASQVCKKWHNIMKNPSIWKTSCLRLTNRWPSQESLAVLSSLKFRRMDIDNLDFEQEGVDFIIHHIKHLEALTLWNCCSKTNLHILLTLAGQQLPLLKEICVFATGLHRKDMLSTLVRNCPNLVTFKWIGISKIASFLETITRLPKLETLSFSFDNSLFNNPAEDLTDIAKRCCLKSLTANCMTLTSTMLDIISNLPSLNELILRYYAIPFEGLQHLEEGIAPITHLHVDCSNNSAGDFMTNVSKMKFLKKLSLKHTNICWKDIKALVNGSSHISSLQIRICTFMDDQCLAQVARLSCLSELSLGPTNTNTVSHITDEGLLALTKSKAPIKFLSLNGLLDITDEGLRYLSWMPYLQNVHITNCKLVTFEGLVGLAENKFPNLCSLDVSDCCLINEHSLGQLEMYPKLLRCLVLQPPLPASAPCKTELFRLRADLVSPWASPSEARFWGRDVPSPALERITCPRCNPSMSLKNRRSRIFERFVYGSEKKYCTCFSTFEI